MTWKETIPSLWEYLRSYSFRPPKKKESPEDASYSTWSLAGETKPYIMWEEEN